MTKQTIFTLEWKRFMRRPAARLALLVWPALLLFAAWNGQQFHAQKAAQQAQLKNKETSYYAAQEALLDSLERGWKAADELPWYEQPSNPLVVGAFRRAGVYQLKPPPAMAWLSIGQADVYPDHYRTGMLSLSAATSVSLENPYHQAIGRFDPAFLLVFLLPLLLIVLGYDLLSADREGGTWPLLQAYAGAPQRLLAVRGLLLWLFAGLTTLLPLLAFGLFTQSLAFGAFAALALAVSAYALFWTGLAAWVNTMGRSSAINGLALTGIWALLLFLLPAAVNTLINSLYPMPSRMSQVAARRTADVQAELAHPDLLDQWYAQHPEIERLPEDQWTWAEYWRHNFINNTYKDSLMQAANQPFEASLQERTALLRKLQYLSPAIVMNECLLRLAAVSQEDFSAFKAQAQAFKTTWHDHFAAFFWERRDLSLQDLQNRPDPSPAAPAAPQPGLWIALVLWGLLPVALSVRQRA
jgi:ABC-2 type transport system permease protein